MSVAIAVPCLPRSGSSMVAGILHHLGVDMGEGNRANQFNERGYFEDVRFLNFHRAVSATVADRYRLRLRLPAARPHLFGDLAVRYSRLLAACGRRPLWGVTDPELAYYFDEFIRLMPPGVEVRVAVPRRDPAAVAGSLRGKFAFTAREAGDIVADYTQALDRLVVAWPGPIVEIDYDDCLADPGAAVAALADLAGVPATDKAVSSVDAGLRHHHAAGGSVRMRAMSSSPTTK